jgi:hypothetical protein
VSTDCVGIITLSTVFVQPIAYHSHNVILTKNCSDDKIKDSVMGQAFDTCGRRVSYLQGTGKKKSEEKRLLGKLRHR